MDKATKTSDLPKSVIEKWQFLQATKNVIKDADFNEFKADKWKMLQSHVSHSKVPKPSDALASCVSERTTCLLNSSKPFSPISLSKLLPRSSSNNLTTTPKETLKRCSSEDKTLEEEHLMNAFNSALNDVEKDEKNNIANITESPQSHSHYQSLLNKKMCKPSEILIAFDELDSIKPGEFKELDNFVRGVSDANKAYKSTIYAKEVQPAFKPEICRVDPKPNLANLKLATPETKSLDAMQEYDNFLLSNIDWDDEDVDWATNDMNTVVLDSPPQQDSLSKISSITKDDYVDDNFDISSLGVMDNASTSHNENNTISSFWNTTLNANATLADCNNQTLRFVPVDKDVNIRKDDTAAFQKSYPHSAILRDILHERFGLKAFRPNQEEIINASLDQHDCFVLMPTGGGKSLCYQLPALLMPGVTIVISPLRALITDQVNKLNSLDIPAAHMCADISKTRYVEIMKALNQMEPTLKLLFLTPEKIVGSKQTFETLEMLYKREKLARIVLDEAHCLSHWGHDFRPDYKQLSTLRRSFPKTPIMCLTATATSVVQQDVVGILKLNNVKSFIRSFNRPNIKYAVIEKGKSANKDAIGKLINSKFARKSGIVYSLARKDCDLLAPELLKVGIKAISYHAGLTDAKREKAQSDWMNNQAHVICATIAFGMGIDKPDVRFVIHNSLPKSVEGFYQESGRAGRDGETAYSYLFYSYSDVIRLQKIIRLDKSISKHNLEAHFDQISLMAQYCENRTDCRRYLQLLHLGEKFDRKLCMADKRTICDNCTNSENITIREVVKESRELATLVKELGTHRNFTMLHFVDVYKGSKLKKILEFNHNQHKFFAAGAHLDKTDIQRIMKQLSFKKIFADHCSYNGEFPVTYLKPGPNFPRLYDANASLSLPIAKSRSKQLKVTKGDEVNSQNSISNPVEEGVKPTALVKGTKRTSSSLIESPQKSRDNEVHNLKTKCHEELLEQCAIFAAQLHSNLSSIMNLAALKTMSEELPKSAEDFLKIQYVTKANFDKFGMEFLAITRKYHAEVEKIEVQNTLEAFQNDSEDDWATSKPSKTTVKSVASSSSTKSSAARGKPRYFKRFKSAKKK